MKKKMVVLYHNSQTQNSPFLTFLSKVTEAQSDDLKYKQSLLWLIELNTHLVIKYPSGVTATMEKVDELDTNCGSLSTP